KFAHNTQYLDSLSRCRVADPFPSLTIWLAYNSSRVPALSLNPLDQILPSCRYDRPSQHPIWLVRFAPSDKNHYQYSACKRRCTNHSEEACILHGCKYPCWHPTDTQLINTSPDHNG